MKKLTFCVMALLGANMAFAEYPTFENTAGLAWEYVNNGATVVMDYNNDGYDEFFYYETSNGANPTRNFVYMRNDEGAITRSDVDVLGLPKGINNAGLAAIDANNDGFKDLLVAGNWPMMLDLYINTDDGNGGRKFVKDETQTALRGARDYSYGDFIAVADFDGDGDEDFFVMAQMYQEGSTENAELRGIVYLNNEGTFAVGQNDFATTYGGGVCAADINNDGKIDIIYTGYTGSTWETHYYTNSGNAEFTEVTGTGFVGTQEASIFVSDFNNDTFNDVIILGHNTARLYLGSEAGSFTEKTNAGLSGNTIVADMADFNNDGKMDFVATAWHVAGESETAIFYGNGDGTFTAQAMAADNSARGGFTIAWDYDADGAMDYFVANYNDSKGYYSALVHQINAWYIVREGVTIGNYGTVCLPYAITAVEGATFWTISGQTTDMFYLDEETEPQPGHGYVVCFTDNALKVKYANHEQATLVDNEALQGTYTDIQDGAAGTVGNVLENNYIVYNNEFRKCSGNCSLAAYRAYLIFDRVPTGEPQSAPKAARMTMAKPSDAPTELDQTSNAQYKTQKLIRNGQLLILREGKEYNATGAKLR